MVIVWVIMEQLMFQCAPKRVEEAAAARPVILEFSFEAGVPDPGRMMDARQP